MKSTWIGVLKAWLRAGKPEPLIFLPPPNMGQKYVDYYAKAHKEAMKVMDLRIPNAALRQQKRNKQRTEPEAVVDSDAP